MGLSEKLEALIELVETEIRRHGKPYRVTKGWYYSSKPVILLQTDHVGWRLPNDSLGRLNTIAGPSIHVDDAGGMIIFIGEKHNDYDKIFSISDSGRSISNRNSVSHT
jgi:hypothetical protein